MSAEQSDRFYAMRSAINKKSFLERIPGVNKIYAYVQKKREEKYLKSQKRLPAPVKSEDNSFLEGLKKENYKPDTQEPEKVLEEEIIAVGDLHGDMNKWNLIRQSMNMHPNQKFIILGDAMDRGDYGVEILCEIKELAEEGRVQYIPGNHDVWAYNYVRAKYSDEDKEIFTEAEVNMEENGGHSTIEKLNNFEQIVNKELQQGRLKRKTSLADLMNWLQKCPMQQVLNIKGTNYCLAHAIFDKEIYNARPNFNLEDNYEVERFKKTHSKTNQAIAGKIKNIVWYRDGELAYMPASLPKGNYILIVGHTPQKQGINAKPIQDVPTIYCDCGKGVFEGYNLSTETVVQFEKDRSR